MPKNNMNRFLSESQQTHKQSVYPIFRHRLDSCSPMHPILSTKHEENFSELLTHLFTLNHLRSIIIMTEKLYYLIQ
jgi:hypothetical protein